MQTREHWDSQLGFILACSGSAVGVRNIWRFSYIVGENGARTFLVPSAIITIVKFVVLTLVIASILFTFLG